MKKKDGLTELRGFARSLDVLIIDISRREMSAVNPNAVAAYSHSMKMIFISREISDKTERAYTIAHELGHALDFAEDERRAEIAPQAMFVAQLAFDRGTFPHREIGEYIVAGEQRAFDNGETILEDAGIKLDRRRTAGIRRRCIRSYERYLGI